MDRSTTDEEIRKQLTEELIPHLLHLQTEVNWEAGKSLARSHEIIMEVVQALPAKLTAAMIQKLADQEE
jgi:hypothetical protein